MHGNVVHGIFLAAVPLSRIMDRNFFRNIQAIGRFTKRTRRSTHRAAAQHTSSTPVTRITLEMGSPITFSNEVQTTNALTHFKEMISVLKSYEFERFMGGLCLESRL